jgi:hypothetical protein
MRDRRADKGINANPQIHQQRSAISWTTRLATASATLASVLAASQDAKAAVIQVSGRPVSISLGSTGDNFWDIDGNGTNESNLRGSKQGAPPKFSSAINWLFSNSFSVVRRRFTISSYGPFTQLVALANGSTIGPTLAAGKSWGASNLGNKFAMRYSYSKQTNGTRRQFDRNSYLTEFNNFNTQQDKKGHLGFRFKIDGNTHYGYGLLEVNVVPFDLTRENITLISWAYNSDPGAPITFSSPDEVPAPLGLAGLAAGAAWTRKLRRRIRASSEAA